MPNYTLNRDHTLRTTDGVLSFVKGESTWVPPAMERHVVSIGGQLDESEVSEVDLIGAATVKEILSHEDRKALLQAALEQIEATNESKDFTGAGVPTVKAVEKITGFDVDRIEVTEAWTEYRASKVA